MSRNILMVENPVLGPEFGVFLGTDSHIQFFCY
jgi:hypothetical protein